MVVSRQLALRISICGRRSALVKDAHGSGSDYHELVATRLARASEEEGEAALSASRLPRWSRGFDLSRVQGRQKLLGLVERQTVTYCKGSLRRRPALVDTTSSCKLTLGLSPNRTRTTRRATFLLAECVRESSTRVDTPRPGLETLNDHPDTPGRRRVTQQSCKAADRAAGVKCYFSGPGRRQHAMALTLLRPSHSLDGAGEGRGIRRWGALLVWPCLYQSY